MPVHVPSRYPWASIVATIAVALVVQALLVAYAFDRLADAQRLALSAQQDRLNRTALRIEDYLGVEVQLTRVAAVELGREARANAARDLHTLLNASDRTLIYGIGAFYVTPPYEPVTGRYGAYWFALDPQHDRLQTVGASSGYYYQDRPWFVAALNANGTLVFSGPYTSSHGLTFLGASEAFFTAQRDEGVVLVEARQPTLARILSPPNSSDAAWITDASGKAIVGTAARGSPGGSVMEAHLRLAPWTLHSSSGFEDVARERTALLSILLPVSLAAWAVAAAIGLILVRVRRLQLEAIGLQETANRDALTGLHNRTYIVEYLESRFAEARAGRGNPFGVLFLDLDRFAVVNDSLGHAAGDDLLRLLARRIEEALPAGIEIARIGGDEFVICVPTGLGRATPERVAEIIADRLNAPFVLGEREVYIGASIGIVADGTGYQRAGDLLRDVDTAMYAAKHAGRGGYAVFDARMHRDVMVRLAMESELRKAVKNEEVFVKYQPIVRLRTGAVCGLEALARWKNGGEEVSAATFIPLAERTGMIDAIDSRVLACACRDARRLQAVLPGLAMSINVSAVRLHQPDFVAKIARAIADSAFDGTLLKLELTETAIMDRAEAGVAILEELRSLGLQLVIDDFGTGHSSLSYVQRLPVSALKIDRSFVIPLEKQLQSVAIVRAIVALATTLNLSVTAEGVETEGQARMLLEMGVDFGQGYYFAPALDFADVEPYVAAHRDGSVERAATLR